MKVVIVHDYLNQRGGAERVVGVLHEMYPDAPIYTLFVDKTKLWPSLQDATIIPSLLQWVPFIMKHFKLFFWLYPLAIRTLRLPDCDVVITSSSAYAKGVPISRNRDTKPLHVCYCHTPMRFAWNYDSYIAHETQSPLLAKIARSAVPLLKQWDQTTSRDVDVFIANSTEVQSRIHDFYQREAIVIHPPVDTYHHADAQVGVPVRDYYLVVSRLVSYKRIDLAVKACAESRRPLVVIGTGPDKARLESLAGPTVQFLGWQSDEAVVQHMASCRALIFPGEEDFGITPVEANAVGTPVVAYHKGGVLDTIEHGTNGIFFDKPSVTSLLEALELSEQTVWDPDRIRQFASRFSRDRFEQQVSHTIRRLVATYNYDANGLNVPITQGGLSR